jgi:hypothetical protein
MAKPNYAFAKRQRDLAKKQKKEEKRQRKAATQPEPPAEAVTQTPGEEAPKS